MLRHTTPKIKKQAHQINNNKKKSNHKKVIHKKHNKIHRASLHTQQHATYSTSKQQSPLEVYEEGVKKKLLKEDPRQRGTIIRLDQLYQQILALPPDFRKQYDLKIIPQKATQTTSSNKSSGGFLSSLFGSGAKSSTSSTSSSPVAMTTQQHIEQTLAQMNSGQLPSCKGLYIHGGVGCGKTMMMDMFFDQIPKSYPKVRKHFHSFMLETHAKVHRIRQADTAAGLGSTDVLPRIAKQFVEEEGVILCLDEFQVTDVADAMILKELFSALFAAGCIVVSTSNRAPENLYYNGINRESFLPFIDVLKSRCDVLSMDAMTDYRTLVAQEEGLIHFPSTDPAVKKQMDLIYERLHFGQNDASHTGDHSNTGSGQRDGAGLTLDVAMGRNFLVKRCVPKRVARFEFAELCEASLGAADYMAIAKEFPCILLENVPTLYSDDPMKLRRFITLLDVLYEHRTKVYLSTEGPLDELFQTYHSKDQALAKAKGGTAPNTNDPTLLTSNKDEVFASARAMSRLIEMTSTTYIDDKMHKQGSKDTASRI